MTIETLFRDKLPRGLCFPIGLEAFSERVPELAALNASIVFVWQSTWAAQIFDAVNGESGRLAICQVRQTLPRMRINSQKARAMAENSKVVVAEFTVASTHRSDVLEAFRSQGANLLAQAIRTNPSSSFLVTFNLELRLFAIGEPSMQVW